MLPIPEEEEELESVEVKVSPSLPDVADLAKVPLSLASLDQELEDEWKTAELRASQIREDQKSAPEHHSHLLTFDSAVHAILSSFLSTNQAPTELTHSSDEEPSCNLPACLPIFKRDRPRNRALLPFLLANLPIDWNDETHSLSMRSLFALATTTDSLSHCPRVGGHWEATLGFQGADPLSDINRSQGVMNMLLLMHLLESKVGRSALELSRKSGHDFPFACVSFELGLLAIELYERGWCKVEGDQTSKMANGIRSIARVHVGLWKAFSDRWESKKLRVHEYGDLMKDLRRRCQTRKGSVKLTAVGR